MSHDLPTVLLAATSAQAGPQPPLTPTCGLRKPSRACQQAVAGLILNGADIDDAIRSFPVLTRAQVYECLAYYGDHKETIDFLVARQMADGEQ